MKKLGPIESQQFKIAVKTLRMTNMAVNMLGGMTKQEARDFLKSVGMDDDEIRKIEKST